MPGARELPAVDDHIVEPESEKREELVRGQLVIALPAQPPHGDQHTLLDYVIRSHVAPGYVPSADLLTRFSEGSNFASDVSVRKAGKDAQGHRHLEELAFEVVSTQSRRHMTIRAEDMTERGVRRVFAIFVDEDQRPEHTTVEEWIADEKRWQVLDLDGVLSDPTLLRPLPVRALVDIELAVDEAVKAAELQGSPRIAEIRAASERRGKLDSLTRLLERRFGPLPEGTRRRLSEAKAEQLDAWLDRVLDAATLDDALG